MRLQVVEVATVYTHGRPGHPLRPAPECAAFRAADLYSAADDVAFAPVALADEDLDEHDPIAPAALLGERIAAAVAAGVRSGRRVLMVGGNCACAPGVIGGLQQAMGETTRIGLVWLDAHGDCNTPRTSESGMLGGMAVGVITGLCLPVWRERSGVAVTVPTDRVVMGGVRALYPGEQEVVAAGDIEVAPLGSPELAAAVDRLAVSVDAIYVHIDLDLLDAELVPAHLASEPDGPSIEQTVDAVRGVLATGAVAALALVSLHASQPRGDTSIAAAQAILEPVLADWARREPSAAQPSAL